jgi:hypothetical protein
MRRNPAANTEKFKRAWLRHQTQRSVNGCVLALKMMAQPPSWPGDNVRPPPPLALLAPLMVMSVRDFPLAIKSNDESFNPNPSGGDVMALAKKTKQLLLENAEERIGRLANADSLSLKELMEISHQQERELMTYLMAQPQRKFDKLMAAIGPRWREYAELKLRNRARLKELAAQQGEPLNGN